MTRFLSDGQEEIGEYTGTNALLRRYVYGPSIDERLAQWEAGGAKYYLQTNHQGSMVLSSDASQALTAYRYDAYGRSTNPGTGTPFRYTGRRYDPETGLYYYRARYYSPEAGRFLQTDPIGPTDDFNLYAYVGNDPLNNTDPTGEFLVTGLVGAALEFGVQAVEISIGVRDGFDGGDIAVAAITSAAGFGLAKQVANLQRVSTLVKVGAEIASDAAVSAASTAAKGEGVTVGGVVADVVGAQSLGKIAGRSARSAAERSPTNKVLERQANRKERIAEQSSRQGRQDAAREARQQQRDYVSSAGARATTSAANVGSATREMACTSKNLPDKPGC